MQATCPAHQVIIDLFSDPEYGQCDPVPAECAKWLAEVTSGAPASFAGNNETGELAFGPGESSPETFEAEPHTSAMLLRSVEVTTIGLRDPSYSIYRYDGKLCVFFVIYDPTGIACWSRIDINIAG